MDFCRRPPAGPAPVPTIDALGLVFPAGIQIMGTASPYKLGCRSLQRPSNLPRDSGDQAPSRDMGSLQDHTIGCHEGAFANPGLLEDHGVDPNHASILYGTALELGPMSHGDICTNDGGLPVSHVDDAVILDVASRADSNSVFRMVPPKNSPEPDGRLRSHLDIADEDG